MSIAFIALAALLAGGAQDGSQPNRNEIAAAPTESGGSSAKADKKRYCIAEAPTGTRMVRKTCLTKAEWLDQGIDPTAPN
jgi:hypothetical protein